jgi:hypothetical protein
MTLEEIKKAIEEKKKVYWSNKSYEVIKEEDYYYVLYIPNSYAIGLTWLDGITLNGKEEEFFTE